MPPKTPSLPQSIPAFRKLVAAQRTEEALEALYKQTQAEWRRYSAIFRHGPNRPAEADTPEGRLFERRLLEIVRTPRGRQEYGWRVWSGQYTAWGDLVRMRSEPFRRMLRQWIAGSHRNLAAQAAMHLAWMGRKADVPALRRIIGAAGPRMIDEVASGAAHAVQHKRMEPGVTEQLLRAMTPYITCAKRLRPASPDARNGALSSIVTFTMRADRRAAIRLLSGPAVLRPDNPALRSALLTLTFDAESNPASYPRNINARAVWAAYEALRSPRRKAESHDQILGMLLVLGAYAEPARATREIKALRGEIRGSDWLQLHSREARNICRNIPSPETLLDRLYAGALKLKPDAMAVVEAYSMHRYVLGDGLEGYLSDMGHKWEQAHKGLLIVGQTKPAEALAVAAKRAFGNHRIKTRKDVDRATDANIGTTEKEWDAFVKVCDRYWKPAENVPRAIERHIAAHPDHFRPR